MACRPCLPRLVHVTRSRYRLLGANAPWAVAVALADRRVRSQILQASLFTDNAGRDDQYSTDSFFNKWVLS
jgi:hypothetical protein